MIPSHESESVDPVRAIVTVHPPERAIPDGDLAAIVDTPFDDIALATCLAVDLVCEVLERVADLDFANVSYGQGISPTTRINGYELR